jgi:hypothetical protein
MSVSYSDSVASVDDSTLRGEASRIQASGVLGESRIRRLFDYFLESSLAGRSPKEIAIAMDVFGKSADFDVGNDALVRVYIHKLRKALDEFYSSSSNGGRAVIHIPRGEYRLRINEQAAEPRAEPQSPIASLQGTFGPTPGALPRANRQRAALWVAILGSVSVIAVALAWTRMPHTDLDRVRANPIWSAILNDDRPIMIVLGDYYLIGELDATGVKRLVREYSVNSKSDLADYVAEHPETADRYLDVGIRYLPIAAASALRDVMVVLAPENRRISVSKMSDLEPGSLKSADIVYIGYLSGMGMFQDLTFAGSRFTVGDSYDEIIDKTSKHSYVSDVGGEIVGPPRRSGTEQSYHDYGMFTKFRGPGGNTVVVISGTRDEGVSQTAEAFTNEQMLQELGRRVNAASPIEALLDVSSFDGVNLSGKLLVASGRKDQVFR